MIYLTIPHPVHDYKNVMVRIYEDNGYLSERAAAEELFHMNNSSSSVRVKIRYATDAEIKALDDEEQDMEAHEPDIGFEYPKDRNEILSIMKLWENPLTVQDILKIVTDECFIGCTNAQSAMAYLAHHHPHEIDDMGSVHALLDVLNFHAIRENREKLQAFI